MCFLFQVSLDARVRDIINRNMVEPMPHTFNEAQLQIYTLMHRDSYPRFVNSAVYRKLAQFPVPSRKGSAAWRPSSRSLKKTILYSTLQTLRPVSFGYLRLPSHSHKILRWLFQLSNSKNGNFMESVARHVIAVSACLEHQKCQPMCFFHSSLNMGKNYLRVKKTRNETHKLRDVSNMHNTSTVTELPYCEAVNSHNKSLLFNNSHKLQNLAGYLVAWFLQLLKTSLALWLCCNNPYLHLLQVKKMPSLHRLVRFGSVRLASHFISFDSSSRISVLLTIGERRRCPAGRHNPRHSVHIQQQQQQKR